MSRADDPCQACRVKPWRFRVWYLDRSPDQYCLACLVLHMPRLPDGTMYQVRYSGEARLSFAFKANLQRWLEQEVLP